VIECFTFAIIFASLVGWLVIKSIPENDDAIKLIPHDAIELIPHTEIKTGYYVAIRNHGLPVPPAGQQGEIVWVAFENGERRVYTAEHEGQRQALRGLPPGLPLNHFVFIEQWSLE